MTDPSRPPADSRADLRDPGPMRALAHPARLRILGILRLDGPATVGALARATGEAPGAVSYHVATLAKHGLIEEAPELARDRRERWWRAAHARTSWDAADALGDPARHAASDALRRTVLESYQAELLAALAAEASLETEWIAASDSSDGAANLTIEEFRELAADLAAVHAKWLGRGRDREPGGEVRTVRWITHAFPRSGA
ncbi:ArsR/SmtB family transcription factor [Agromyces marinus]|nr:winged helix-turn-helix domain-containing protein [Agromyces marinus]UIP57888.1 hypothetical protein DSM26151_07550 [Agromyces marinus]